MALYYLWSVNSKTSLNSRINFSISWLFVISLFFTNSLFGQELRLNKAEKSKNSGIVFINGKESTHQELRATSPSKIKAINIISEQREQGKSVTRKPGIIEVTLAPVTDVNANKPTPLQITLNNKAFTEEVNMTPPLLVFNNFICRDQNPNNINAAEMEWIDVIVGDSAISKYGEKAASGLIIAELKTVTAFVNAESSAEFPGGNAALMKFIKNNTRYPEAALKEGLSGKVYVSFVITKTGKVEKVKIARGIHPILDSEAIRVVSSLPDWKPAELYFHGKFGSLKIDIALTVPVEFKLPDQSQ